MSEDSPHFWFDLDSRGSLFRKVYCQQYITKDEIIRVLEADTHSHHDPRMMPILIASHRGALVVRKGRPQTKDTSVRRAKLFIASDDYKVRLEQIRLEHKKLTSLERKSLPSASNQAANEIVFEHKLHISGNRFLTEISSLKSVPLFGE